MAGPDYEEVRRKLRERGYLEGRLERFVLHDPRRLLRSSGKAALLGAPVLGALLAAAAVAANRPLLGTRDALVLWLYFSVLAGAALFVLDLTAAAFVAALARRRGAKPSDALRAALLVGLPTLAYLVALWTTRRGAGGVAADLVFLAAAALATFFAAWLAGLVSLAAIVGRTGDVPDRRRRPIALAALLAGAAGLAMLAARAGEADPGKGRPASPLHPVAAGRLIFIGVDGLDAGLARALAARGALPALTMAAASGARWPLTRATGAEPPEVWTTLLTGTPAQVHGVRTVGAERLPGIATPLGAEAGPVPLTAALRFLLPARTVPTSGAARAVRTVWEVVDLVRPAAAVGFWSTWPADAGAGGGYVVSDRALPALLSGGSSERAVAPEALWPRLRARFPEQRAGLAAEAETRFSALAPRTRALAAESLLIDGWSLEVLTWLLEDDRLAVGCVYLPGLDILRHRLLAGAEDADAARLLDAQAALEGYARWLDARLAPLLVPPAGARLLVVADAGRTRQASLEGFVVALGAGVPAGCRGAALEPVAVAPLALSLTGFPRSQELPGAPSACVPAGAPSGSVETYGRRPLAPAPESGASDPQVLERLKSLGYIR